jgi:hypothetical protein
VKGCARSLLIQFAAYLATAGAIASLLHSRLGHPLPKLIAPSLIGGLAAVIGAGLLLGISKPVRDRAALAACLAGKRPADGARAGLAGTIDAIGEPLRAPFSGKECVAWSYEIWEMKATGSRSSKVVYFEGLALTPSAIATPAGAFRLLAVPTLDLASEGFLPSEALARFKEHVKTASFETTKPRGTLAQMWSDDDGSYRREVRAESVADVPLELCRFTEGVVGRGERVYVIGRYSESRGGIVPDPNWAKDTRLMKGDPAEILRQLRGRIVRYAIGGVVFLGVSAAIVAAFTP